MKKVFLMSQFLQFATLTLLLCLQLTIKVHAGVILPDSSTKRVMVPQSDIGDSWNQNPDFEDSDWLMCEGAPGGVGYDLSGAYHSQITLDLQDRMYVTAEHPNSSCYVRIPFELDAHTIAAAESLYLWIKFDDAFVAYLNGEEIAHKNRPARLQWDSRARTSHEAEEYVRWDISSHRDRLQRGTNLLALHAMNRSVEDRDFFINAKLTTVTNPLSEFHVSNLPLVFIDTDGQKILNDQRITANMGVIYHGPNQPHRLDEPFNAYDGRISIEIRGSSSATWVKKQYNVETQQPNGDNLNISLMGLPTENDWILNAPYIDKSLMRNVLAYDLARRMGHYASRTRYCELFLNGEYHGIYILMEKIKRDNDRVDIAELDSSDVNGDALTGGYIIKVDKHPTASNSFESRYKPPNNNEPVRYQYHDPAPDELLPVQRRYIQRFIFEFEYMMAQDNSTLADYLTWMELGSFLDFFIISELSKNVDAYRLSTFLYKDRDSNDPRLHAGPVWDFNIAFGLADYGDAEDTDGWMVEEMSKGTVIPFWWQKLFHDRRVRPLLADRWFELRQHVLSTERLHRYIDAVADTLNAAQQRNFTIWTGPGEPKAPEDGFWPVPDVFYTFDSYQDEVEYLKYWISQRVDWMDEHIVLETSVDLTSTRPSGLKLLSNYPNPFNLSTTLQFELPHSAHVSLRIYNMSGQLLKTLYDGERAAGLHSLVWNGRETAGNMVGSGVYMARLIIQGAHQPEIAERKLLLLK